MKTIRIFILWIQSSLELIADKLTGYKKVNATLAKLKQWEECSAKCRCIEDRIDVSVKNRKQILSHRKGFRHYGR